MSVWRAVFAGGVFLAWGLAAAQDRPAPDNWPTSELPPPKGQRVEMEDLARQVPAQNVCLKTSQQDKDGHVGSAGVGDELSLSIAIGDRATKLFGSVKDGRDGGRIRGVVFWMDAGGKVVKEDASVIKLAPC
jgi:hypothetical protein